MTVPTYIENAAFEAHMAAVDSIKASGIRNGKPDIKIVTKVLARAYGDALGLLIASGADEESIQAIGQVAKDASEAMFCHSLAKSCAGSA